MDHDTLPYGAPARLVACFVGKRKHFRRVFARCDKYTKRYLAFVRLASTLLWPR